ncbi:hypothetical protein HanIR_Chr15g0781851 [Helianthus annuus]|nr:hypothetical protein HanIR_Chr15g0781851 [Helianthus annuus]
MKYSTLLTTPALWHEGRLKVYAFHHLDSTHLPISRLIWAAKQSMDKQFCRTNH